MPMRKNPMHDVDNPPGQATNRPQPVKYLRDVIRKYQEEEKLQEPPLVKYATSVSTTAEKRLEDLQRGLLRLCRQCEDPDYPTRGGWRGWLRARDIHDLLKESL